MADTDKVSATFTHPMNDLDFPEIYEAFQPRIFRYVSRLVGDSEAEDLTQEIFIKLDRALKDFRGESSLSTWIYQIATNASLDKLRSSSYQQAGQVVPETSLDTNAVAVSVSAGKPSIEKQLIRDEMNECIRGYIERLPEDYRTVLVLSEYEGLRNNEIAGILDATLDTIKIRLHRARSQLKRELEAHCEIYWIEEIPCNVKKPMK